jgi:poly(3-hydroxybutyrate) depolymerase
MIMAAAAWLKRVARACALTLLASLAAPAMSEPLPALGADLGRTSVSGLSSGAYMAGQFQIAYSGLVIGAGIVAGGPYGCASAPGTSFVPLWPFALSMNLDRALNRCMQDGGWFSGVPSASELGNAAKELADKRAIDPLAGLKADKVYIFSGANDDTVERAVVERAAELYEELGVPKANITFIKHEKAAHAFVTEEGGLACGTAGEPFINDCDYDQARAVLEAIYGPLSAAGGEAGGRYVTFEQGPFLSGLGSSGMADEGVAFIPESCTRQAGCAPHIVFHGCKQERERIGDAFIKGSGFARWAATNRIIVLFPQVEASGAGNPNGCWDWWGYTGRHFLEREAPQMVAVRRMLGKLAAPR